MNTNITKKQLEDKLQIISFDYYQAFIDGNKDEIRNLRDTLFMYVIDYMKIEIDYICKSINEIDRGDILSESLRVLLNKIDNNEYDPYYNETSRFTAFVKTIIKGQYSNYIKKLKNESEHLDRNFINDDGVLIETGIGDLEDNYFSPEKNIHQEEIIDIILSIAKNDEERNFINIVFIERVLNDDISNKEIASMFGWSEAYVSKRIKQLKERLKEVLIEYKDNL